MSFTNTNVRQQSKRPEFPFQNPKSNQRGNKKWANQSQHASNPNGRPNQLQASPPASQSSSANQQSGSPLSSPGLGKPIENSVQENDAKHMHDRMLFLLTNLVGMTVQITVKDGSKFEGVFHGASTQNDLGIVLKLARKLGGGAEGKSNPNPVIPNFIVLSKDLVEINAVGVDFTATDKTYGERDSFKTDTDISGRAEIKERELHPWNPDDYNNETFATLEDDAGALESNSNGNGSWDQFAVNEKLFGLRTDFDEDIYTTKLDRNAPDFKDREKRAIEVANQIQRSAVTNVHVLEERGITVDDSGLDEEDKYGAVVRNPNKYTPPALRKQQQQHQPVPPTQSTQSAQLPQPTPPATVTATPAATPPSSKSSLKEPIKPAMEPKSASVTQIVTASTGKPTGSTPSPISHLPTIRSETHAVEGRDGAKKPIDAHPPKRTEVPAADIMSTFRQFAMTEKEKLQQKKQALAKKEKSDRLADLKKFHQNFRLNMPVPLDLIPLLSKGKKNSPTQTEGENFLERPKESAVVSSSHAVSSTASSSPADAIKKPGPEKGPEEKTTSISVPAVNASTAGQKSASAKETAETTTTSKLVPSEAAQEKQASSAASATTFKFNVNVKEFKPNPSALAFTPGGNQAQTQKTSAEMSPFFGGRQLKKGPLSISEALASPFSKGKVLPNPSTIPPHWPFGKGSYRNQFAVTNPYEEDIYVQAAVTQGYPYPYPVQTQFRYPPQMPQFGMPPMPMQQGAPMQYMNPAFAQAGFQQFVPNMSFTTAPMPHAPAPPAVYSPQIQPQVAPPHQPYGTQGFPSPQRAPMVAPGMHQLYPYQSPHGPMMMRYPPEMMANMSPNGMMIAQRPPIMMDPNMMHYVPSEQPMAIEVPSEPTMQ